MIDLQYTEGLLKSQAVYVDINDRFGEDGASPVVLDIEAVNVGLANLLSTPVGSCGPIFNPTFGAILLEIIGEPVDQVTAYKIRSGLIQAIETWETRIILDMGQSDVIPDPTIPGFRIRIAYRLASSELSGSVSFQLKT